MHVHYYLTRFILIKIGIVGLHRSKVVWSETPYWISGSLAVRRGFHNPKVRGSSLSTTFFFQYHLMLIMVHFNTKNANFRVCKSKVYRPYYLRATQPIPLSLTRMIATPKYNATPFPAGWLHYSLWFETPHVTGGGTPICGGYQLSSSCQQTPFWVDLTPNNPLFLQSTPLCFFHFRIKFYIQIANFCAFCAHIEKFCGNCNIKCPNFGLKLHFCTLNVPIFGSPHQKRSIFLSPRRMTPFFSTKSYTECPLFSLSGRHMYVTFIFECPRGSIQFTGFY